MKKDIIIIGAGPCGATAAIYTARAGLDVMVFDNGQSALLKADKIENYYGFDTISGRQLYERGVKQLESMGVERAVSQVLSVAWDGAFTVGTDAGKYTSDALLIATGAKREKPPVPAFDDYLGRGASYCAVCDGAFYKDGVVAVIGGGNTALQEAVMLSDICKKVYVVQNLAFLTGEELLARELEKRPNVEIIFSSTVTQLLGDGSLEGIKIASPEGERELAVDGVFVAVGQKPENEPFKNVVPLDEYGYISAGESCVPENSAAGIYAAGDCRTKAVRQVTTAAADGAVAALAACRFVDSLK